MIDMQNLMWGAVCNVVFFAMVYDLLHNYYVSNAPHDYHLKEWGLMQMYKIYNGEKL